MRALRKPLRQIRTRTQAAKIGEPKKPIFYFVMTSSAAMLDLMQKL